MPNASTYAPTRGRAACLSMMAAISTGLLVLATSSFAQAPKRFGAADMATIVDTLRTNKIRFDRDFKGQAFQATLPVARITERKHSPSPNDTYVAVFGPSPAAGKGYMECEVKDQSTIRMMMDWDKGQMVKITGKIRDEASYLNVGLDDCEFEPLPK